MPNADLTPDYGDDWLPEDFKPMGFKQLIWSKLKSAPLVGVGLVATGASFCMASYYNRLGHSHKMNYWLRWRVATQAATVGALIYYGGVAMNAEKQYEFARKQLVLLGELPTDTPISHVDNKLSWSGQESAADKAYREAVQQSSQRPSSKPIQEEIDENAKFYPLPMSERVQAAEWAARLRAAEKAHEAEEAAKRSGLNSGGSTPGELLAKRMEQAYANRPEGSVDKKFKVSNKNKLRKQAEDNAAVESETESIDA